MNTKSKLLLVDDEVAITDRLEPFLSRAGFKVKVVDDGELALKEIVSYLPDLVILDVLMPKLDGREVLRQLRQKGDWTPVILLTQVGELAERAMAIMEGADDYINKPFDSNELVARIQSILRRARPNQPPLTVAERLRCGDLVVDRTKRRAYLNNEEISLSPKAISLLEYMITPVTAQRLRHTFASQMLTAGMPVSSLQRYLGHEHLDTTMIYAEVSDPLLRQDYYQGIEAFDPDSENLTLSGPALTNQHILRQLVEELKIPDLEQSRHDEILDIILAKIK